MSCKFFQQLQRMRPDASRFAGADGCAEGDAVLLHATPKLVMSYVKGSRFRFPNHVC